MAKNWITKASTTGLIGASNKVNKKPVVTLTKELDADLDWNPLVALQHVTREHIRGTADTDGNHFYGLANNATTPATDGVADFLGLVLDELTLVTNTSEVRKIFDDRGLGVLQLSSYAGATLAPAGKMWLRNNAGAAQYSYDGGAWAAFGGGLGAGDNITWTGNHSWGTGTAAFTNGLAVTGTLGLTGDLTVAGGDIDIATGRNITVGGNAIVTSDKLNAAMISGTVPVANGGTNFSSYTVGDEIYASASGVLSRRAAVAVGQMPISQGTATPSIWSAAGCLTSLQLTSGSYMKLLAWTSDTKYLAFAEAAASPSYRGIKGQEGSGTNIVGGDLRLAVGAGTGTGTGGALSIYHALKTTTSGTTLSSLFNSWNFTAPTATGDGTGVAESDLLPGTTAGVGTGNNLGSDTKRLRSAWFNEYLYALRLGAADDTNSYLEFDGSDGVSLTLGGTLRYKVSSTFARYAFGGVTLDDSYLIEAKHTGTAACQMRTTSGALFGGFYAQADDPNAGLYTSHWGTGADGTTFCGGSNINSSWIRGIGGHLSVGTNAASKNLYLGANNVEFIQCVAGGEILFSQMFKTVSGNQQTTVGAAGAASALPANPTVYIKFKNAAGTTLVFPAYAAA